MDIHIVAELQRWYRGINLYVYEKSHERLAILKDPTFEIVPEGAMPEEMPIHLTNEAAQELMDGLWNCGIRPSEGSGSAGSLLATQNHLKDMQSLSWRLLTIIEKKE